LTALDSKQYKEEQRQGYNSVAAAWNKWWKTIERATEVVSRRLVELAEIKPGSKVLDIAEEKYTDNTTGKVRLENEAILIVGTK
jgi:hypothetical protein